jgi:hypothetical protein
MIKIRGDDTIENYISFKRNKKNGVISMTKRIVE